jgi:DNA-binding transcriptional ArsR family regulator
MKNASEQSKSKYSNRSQTWQTVTDPKAVKLLLELESGNFFAHFLLESYSVKQIALKLEMSLNAAHHRIKQLERAGLLYVEKREARPGRAIKHYRATASGFFVPFTASNSETFANFVSQQLLPLHEHFYTLATEASDQLIQDIGYRIYDAGGFVNWDFSPQGQHFEFAETLLHPDSPALLVVVENLRLNREKAKALQHDIASLLERYSKLGGTEDYAIYVGMTPGKLLE